MTKTINGYSCSSAWEEAIARAGGPTKLGRAIELSYQRVRQIQRDGTDRASLAKKVEDATGVPAVEILGLADWNPEPRGCDPDDDGGKGTKVIEFPPVPAATTTASVAAHAHGGVRGACVVRPISARSAAKQKRESAQPERSACTDFCNPVDSFAPEYKRTGTEG